MHDYKPPENYERLIGIGVAGRSDVARLAKSSASQALTIARAIQHPWYRCQALTYVVEANPSHPDAEAILNEALAAAYSQSEPNRVATVAMWPLKQLVKVNLHSASHHTKKLLGVISQEPHGLRRLDGLYSILWAVASAEELRNTVLLPFRETAKVSQGWRSERTIDCAIHAIAPYDRNASLALLNSRPETRFTKRSRVLLGVCQAHVLD